MAHGQRGLSSYTTQSGLVLIGTLPLHLDALDTGLQHFVLSCRISLDNRPPGADTALPDSGERGSAKPAESRTDRKSTRLNSSHGYISYAVFCLKKKTNKQI